MCILVEIAYYMEIKTPLARTSTWSNSTEAFSLARTWFQVGTAVCLNGKSKKLAISWVWDLIPNFATTMCVVCVVPC